MQAKVLTALLGAILLIGGALFSLQYFKSYFKTEQVNENGIQVATTGGEGDGQSEEGKEATASGSENGSNPEEITDSSGKNIQQQLDQLSRKFASELEADQKLNLNMVAQLRTYQEMLGQLGNYAKGVEKDLKIIEQMSKNSFQEDVKLQASLFSGKKPSIVSSHLEKFRSSRVGAILAKMKEKEASSILDTWAKQQDPKVVAFYQEVMAAYLNNRRHDMHPKLFTNINEKKQPDEPRGTL